MKPARLRTENGQHAFAREFEKAFALELLAQPLVEFVQPPDTFEFNAHRIELIATALQKRRYAANGDN